MAKIANVELTNTFNTWRVQTNKAFDRLSQFSNINSALYANTVTANTAFVSKSTSLLTGAVTLGSTLRYGGVTLSNTATGTGNMVLSTSPNLTGVVFASTLRYGGVTLANTATGTGNMVLSTSPALTTPALGTPSSGALTNCSFPTLNQNTTGTAAGLSATLAVASGGTGVTSSTGSGSVVLSTSPALTTPTLGTPSSGNLANCSFPTLNQNTTGTAAGLSATLAVASGGTGVTSSTGSGANVLSTSPALTTPALGTPSSGNLANCSFPTLNQNTSGSAASLSATLAVASGGTGVTSSTGSGSVVLSTSPALTTPALGTPSSGNLANCSFPTLNQNTTGNAATASSMPYTGLTGAGTFWKQVYSGTVAFNSTSVSHIWQILYGGAAREAVSPDQFMFVTAVADYFTISGTGYNTITTTKSISLSNNTADSRFNITWSSSTYPLPNQINIVIYVASSSAVTSLTFVS